MPRFLKLDLESSAWATPATFQILNSHMGPTAAVTGSGTASLPRLMQMPQMQKCKLLFTSSRGPKSFEYFSVIFSPRGPATCLPSVPRLIARCCPITLGCSPAVLLPRSMLHPLHLCCCFSWTLTLLPRPCHLATSHSSFMLQLGDLFLFSHPFLLQDTSSCGDRDVSLVFTAVSLAFTKMPGAAKALDK